MKTRKQPKRRLPESNQEWFDEVVDAYLDAYEAIPFGALIGENISEDQLFHMAPLVCLKFRGIKATKTHVKQATDAMLSSYVATSDINATILTIPHIAFSFAYLASHYGIGALQEASVEEVMKYFAEHHQELEEAIERQREKLANQAL